MKLMVRSYPPRTFKTVTSHATVSVFCNIFYNLRFAGVSSSPQPSRLRKGVFKLTGKGGAGGTGLPWLDKECNGRDLYATIYMLYSGPESALTVLTLLRFNLKCQSPEAIRWSGCLHLKGIQQECVGCGETYLVV